MTYNLRLFSDLEPGEKDILRLKVMILCPEIFGQGTRKYERVPLALIELGGCVSSNVRDAFSAGGRIEITDERGYPHTLRGIDAKLLTLLPLLPAAFNELREADFRNFWGDFQESCDERLESFLTQLDQESSASQLDIRLSQLVRNFPGLSEVCYGR